MKSKKKTSLGNRGRLNLKDLPYIKEFLYNSEHDISWDEAASNKFIDELKVVLRVYNIMQANFMNGDLGSYNESVAEVNRIQTRQWLKALDPEYVIRRR